MKKYFAWRANYYPDYNHTWDESETDKKIQEFYAFELHSDPNKAKYTKKELLDMFNKWKTSHELAPQLDMGQKL